MEPYKSTGPKLHLRSVRFLYSSVRFVRLRKLGIRVLSMCQYRRYKVIGFVQLSGRLSPIPTSYVSKCSLVHL